MQKAFNTITTLASCHAARQLRLEASATVRGTNARSTLLIAMTFVGILNLGCTQQTPTSSPPAPKQTFQITAVSHPLADLTRQIVGDTAKVVCPLPADAEPSKWRPRSKQIAAMQQSDLIITNGSAAPYAKWLTYVTLPESKICAAASDGLSLSDMIAVKDVQLIHSHGPEGEHSHPTMVAYTWLDPAMALRQVKCIAARLKRVYPQHSNQFDANLLKVETQLAALLEIQKSAKKVTENMAVITTTPELKFFTRSLGMRDEHLTWLELPDAASAKTDLTKQLAATHPSARLLLWANDPTKEMQGTAESLGLKNVVIDKLDRIRSDDNYAAAMRRNYETVLAAIQEVQTNTPAQAVAPTTP